MGDNDYGISHIGTDPTTLPVEFTALEELLSMHLPLELHRGLTVQVGTWLVIRDHHHLCGILQGGTGIVAVP